MQNVKEEKQPSYYAIIPSNFNHEEKIFGGYFSIRQAIYLIFGVLMIGIFLIPLINNVMKTLTFTVFTSIFILFAFLKVDETNADRYCIYILKFFFRKKKYILEKGKCK